MVWLVTGALNHSTVLGMNRSRGCMYSTGACCATTSASLPFAAMLDAASRIGLAELAIPTLKPAGMHGTCTQYVSSTPLSTVQSHMSRGSCLQRASIVKASDCGMQFCTVERGLLKPSTAWTAFWLFQLLTEET